MTGLHESRFHVGVLGAPPSGKGTAEAFGSLLREVRLRVAAHNRPKSGVPGKSAAIDLFADAALASWLQEACGADTPVNYVAADSAANPPQNAASVTRLEGVCEPYGEISASAAWVAAQSDIVVLLRDGGNIGLRDSMIRNVLRGRGRDAALCVCIDAGGAAYFVEGYASSPFSPERLKDYIDAMYAGEPGQEGDSRGRPFFLSGLWGKFYGRFMGKYKAKSWQMDDAALSGRSMDDGGEGRGANYSYLAGQFKIYDGKAIEIAKKYRESIYFRSILPFISTILLAVGAYVEIIFGVLPKIAGVSDNFWMIIAGAGFLAQALVNAYANAMAKSRDVSGSRSEFLKTRYIAEFLRVAVRFQPFGVPVSCHRVKDGAFMAQIRRILRTLTPSGGSFGQDDAKKIVDHSIAMIDDQIAYHTNTKNRLERVVKRLKAFHENIFRIGFCFVILRGLLQFAMPFLSDALQGEIGNGVKWITYIRSLSNMMALLLPAWALHFSSKLTLNNFGGLYRHSGESIKNLLSLRDKAESLSAQEAISYETLAAFSEDMLSTRLGEVNDWYEQTAARTVTRL